MRRMHILTKTKPGNLARSRCAGLNAGMGSGVVAVFQRAHRRIVVGSVGSLLSCLLVWGMWGAFGGAALAQDAPEMTPEAWGKDGPVWVVPVRGTIELGLTEFIRRSVQEAHAADAGLILFEVNTFGGLVDA